VGHGWGGRGRFLSPLPLYRYAVLTELCGCVQFVQVTFSAPPVGRPPPDRASVPVTAMPAGVASRWPEAVVRQVRRPSRRCGVSAPAPGRILGLAAGRDQAVASLRTSWQLRSAGARLTCRPRRWPHRPRRMAADPSPGSGQSALILELAAGRDQAAVSHRAVSPLGNAGAVTDSSGPSRCL